MKIFFGIILVVVLGRPYSWEYLFLGGNWEPGGIESGEYRPEKYSFGFHASHWDRYYRTRFVYLSNGIGEGFRIGNKGAEFYFHAQSSALLGFWVVGASYGPVLRTTDENPIDLELSLWTGTFLLLNLRFPSTIKFPANSRPSGPVIGLTITLPAKYPY